MRSIYIFVVFSIALTALFAALLPHEVFALEVPQLRNLPGFENVSSSTQLGDLARSFYGFALAVSGLLAFGMIIWGGILWLLSAARPTMQLEAKKKITGAVTGIALLLGIFIILNTVNPQLTVLRDIAEQTAVTICENTNFGGDCKQVFKSSECTNDENCWRDPMLGFNKIESLKNPQLLHAWLYKDADFKNLCAEVYKEQPDLPGLTGDVANAEYYTCGISPVKSVKLKKEGVVMVYEQINFTGQYRALKSDIANTNDSALDLNPAASGNQKFWGAPPPPPLVFNSLEIPAGFRVSLYSNTGMRDRCAILTKTHTTVDTSIGNEADFLAGKNSEYYLARCTSLGIQSARISVGATEQPGIVSLFDKEDFDGTTTREINTDTPLVNMQIKSLKLNPPKDCDEPSENCKIYAAIFDRNDFFGRCEVFSDSKNLFDFNVGSLMVIKASITGGVIPRALTLYEDINLNESDPSKKEWPVDFSAAGPLHIELGGGPKCNTWHDCADSILKSPQVKALLFENSLDNTIEITNAQHAGHGGHQNHGLSQDAGLCEGLVTQEKDVLRLRNKTDGIYMFRLK